MAAQCDAGLCFCEAARSCTRAEAFEYLPLGSRGWKVCPTSDGACTVKVGLEMEGGGNTWICKPPSPPCVGQAWPDPSSLECELVQSCNFLLDPTCTGGTFDCEPPVDGG